MTAALSHRRALHAGMRLPRPLNCLITALSVAVGAVAAGVVPPPVGVWWAALAAALITGAGNTLNDVVDLGIDRINQPQRPLPRGDLGRGSALMLALVQALAGLGLAWWQRPQLGLVALLVIAGLVLYDLWLKRTALWGNLLVSALAAAAFPFGALAAGQLGRAWIPAGLAFLFHLAREIIKDLEDLEGDRAGGARTLPLRVGVPGTARLAAGVLGVLAVFTCWPWVAGIYGWAYLAPVAGVDALLLWAAWRLLRDQGARPSAQLGRRLKWGMLLGLVAVVAGELA
ncbi:MAG: geranylgeranylglycerol-phosphate geranylgeranyltransferase [Candidatus Latescibacteria bacterium]|nr:geranylgeranylglycerol-phosphate geranylgeranyltransferase [Candidatus Latescibacterota bacterium]